MALQAAIIFRNFAIHLKFVCVVFSIWKQIDSVQNSRVDEDFEIPSIIYLIDATLLIFNINLPLSGWQNFVLRSPYTRHKNFLRTLNVLIDLMDSVRQTVIANELCRI